METQKNCPKRGKITMSKFYMKIFIFAILIWTLRGPSKGNVGEDYSYQSEPRKTLDLRDGRILTGDASSGIRSRCDSESAKMSNTVKSQNHKSGKTKFDRGASSGSTYQPMDEKAAEYKKHLKGTRKNVNGAKSKSNKTRKHDVSVTPLLFAKLLLKDPEKGIDILMLYTGGFYNYARNRFF
ncbi:Uncharacterized protein PCOAH_00051380 [Plasmodium coatneyi]|uniref:Uncharacterized protein n=1 Tax=Plasmodium coatneyi TaxID=208452 RepID=A0A1B1E809_9APIC|nr:Uncharacterized protein PCOAH_00051380 [Plasmodium coatneyi]ANQ11097.1 Uncharacterized protein PCOAH_00051380 [Plasmodium coatneyi]